MLEERQGRIENLLADKQELVQEKNQLLVQLSGKKEFPPFMDTTHYVPKVEHVTCSSDVGTMPPLMSEANSSESSEEEENRTLHTGMNTGRSGHPPRFKDIRARVGRFSGKSGGEDFGLRLSDYKEATADFGWDDGKRAKWFSWFLEGPAKATWQRTLTCIMGINYFQCHELRYEDFGSVQALLESMREYQRIAPEKLSDTSLESILWNKVPYALQREVGELKDWALQELFQRLLKAEARVQERERRQQIGTPTQSSSTTNKKSVPVLEEKSLNLEELINQILNPQDQRQEASL